MSESPSSIREGDSETERATEPQQFEDRDGQKRDLPEEEKEDPTPTFKRQRFEVLPEEARYQWDLPDSLLDYSTKYFTKYVPERDLKESVTQGSLIIS